MALVTVQRSPTPSSHDEDNASLETQIDGDDTLSELCHCSSGTPGSQRSLRSVPPRQRSLGECYFAVKGAAVILPQNECVTMPRQSNSTGGEIQLHLQAMLRLLRSQDTLKMAVRLESVLLKHTRYMAIVSTLGRQDNQESILLGIDYVSPEETTIGLVLPIWASTVLSLDGDGGICVESAGSQHIFKPMSVQAMWSAYQSLHKEVSVANTSYPYFPGGLTHTWVQYYENQISSKEAFRSLWHYNYNDDSDLKAPTAIDKLKESPPERAAAERLIRLTLKDVMQSVDLDEVTSKDIRQTLEERLNLNLNEFKEFIDQEMLIILGQMDKPSKIFDYLYLGTEWNASNWDELRQNKYYNTPEEKFVGHILNVTKEVDNFFPGLFYYMKIRVSDEESTELLKHWDITYKFIAEAKEKKSAVLVHCKKGISRSSSTVIAYAMKAYGWPLEKALIYVKEKRNIITPNKGFMEQLRTYQGILEASQHRNSALFNQLQFVPQQPELVPWNGLHDADAEDKKDADSNRTCVISDKLEPQPSNPAPRLLVASENILKSGPPPSGASIKITLPLTIDAELPLNETVTNVVVEDEIRAGGTMIQTSTGFVQLTKSTQVPPVQTGVVSNLTLKFDRSAKVRCESDEKNNSRTNEDDVIEILTPNTVKVTIDEDSMPNLTCRLPVCRQLQNVERIRDSSDLTLKSVQEILMRRSSNSLVSDSSSLSSGDESDVSLTGPADKMMIGIGLKERRNSKSSSSDSAVADLTGGDSSAKNSSAEALMAQSSDMMYSQRIEILPLDPAAELTTLRRPLSFGGQLETSASCPVVVPVGQVKRVMQQYEKGINTKQNSSLKSSVNRRSSPALMNLNDSDDDDDDDDQKLAESENRKRMQAELKMIEDTRRSQSVYDPPSTTRNELPPTGKKLAKKFFMDRLFRKDNNSSVASNVGTSVQVNMASPQVRFGSVKTTTKWYHEVKKLGKNGGSEKNVKNHSKQQAPSSVPSDVFNATSTSALPAAEVNKVSLKVSQPGKVRYQKQQIERLSSGSNIDSLAVLNVKPMAIPISTPSGSVKKIKNDLESRSLQNNLSPTCSTREETSASVRSLVDIFEPTPQDSETDSFSSSNLQYLLTPTPWRRTSASFDNKSTLSSSSYNIRRVGSFNSVGWQHVGGPLTGRHGRSKSLNRHSTTYDGVR